jgi:hypothetical protein
MGSCVQSVVPSQTQITVYFNCTTKSTQKYVSLAKQQPTGIDTSPRCYPMIRRALEKSWRSCAANWGTFKSRSVRSEGEEVKRGRCYLVRCAGYTPNFFPLNVFLSGYANRTAAQVLANRGPHQDIIDRLTDGRQ